MCSVHMLAVCWRNLSFPYPAVYKWEHTDTTGMAPMWLQRMWYISTSFAFGTEEDREVDTTFKVLLLNIASEKHISKPHGIIQAEVVVGTFYKRCKLPAFSLTVCSNCQLCFMWRGAWDHGKWKWCEVYIAYQYIPFHSDLVWVLCHFLVHVTWGLYALTSLCIPESSWILTFMSVSLLYACAGVVYATVIALW